MSRLARRRRLKLASNYLQSAFRHLVRVDAKLAIAVNRIKLALDELLKESKE